MDITYLELQFTYLLLPQTQTSENNGITLDSSMQGIAQLFLVEVTFPAPKST